MFTTIGSFVIVLGVLVFFHELGHYLVARRNGIEVQEFGMGYPPRLIKLFTYDGTAFTLNLIPFGGFARMKGEDAADMSVGSFNAAGIGARAATLVAGPIMNFILAILFFAASYMAGFPFAAALPRLLDVPAASLADRVGLQVGDILIQAGDNPTLVSGYPDQPMTLKPSLPAPVSDQPATTLRVARDGSIIDLPLPTDVKLTQLLASLDYQPVLDTRITMVNEGSPALAAGLRAGDMVYALNGSVITPENPLSVLTRRQVGQEVVLTVLRGDTWLDLTMTPRENPPAGQGALGVGIELMSALAVMPVGQAFLEGTLFTAQYILFMIRLPVELIMGTIAPGQAELTGPVGIAQMVGDAVSATVVTGQWFPIWRLAAILSAALAITNLLPIPALDGGRLLFLLVEKIRGKRVNPEREGLIHLIGFAVLLGLMVLITFNDLNSTREGVDWLRILGQ